MDITKKKHRNTVGKRLRVALIVFLLVVLLLAATSTADSNASNSLLGIVLDEDDMPLEDALILVWLKNRHITSGRTGSDGRFEFEVEQELSYTLYIFADKDSTPGVDFLPTKAEIDPTEVDEQEFTLSSAASLVVEGNIQFIESEKPPLSLSYIISDPESYIIMEKGNFPLIYGSAPESQSIFISLDDSHLVVPAGVPFNILINSSISVELGRVYRSFSVDKPSHFILERGQLATVDVREYSVPFNIRAVESLQEGVEVRVDEMEDLNFYLAQERKALTSANMWLSEARSLLEEGQYDKSFDAAKRSYIELTQTQSHMYYLYNEASLGVYILIFFSNLVSIAIAFLLLNGATTKLLGSAAIYTAMLAIMYLTYPGSVIISPQIFVVTAAISIIASLITITILPPLMSGRSSDGHLPLRNIIIPIFSIAKRSIRRRRLRFSLVLVSTSVLVMSFVALTSFYEGYGIVVRTVPGRSAHVEGILIRAQDYLELEPIFLPSTNIVPGWLETSEEGWFISYKAENLPVTQPVTRLNDAPIFGIVGVDHIVESEVIDIEAALEEGELPSDFEIMISDSLRRELGVKVGDNLILKCLSNIEIETILRGIFDDDKIKNLKDIDGSCYLPRKIMDVTPEGSPTFISTLCEPSEIVVTSLSTALRMPLVGITRVDIIVGEDVNVNAIAERLVLECGYNAWASSIDGVHSIRLGNYYERKGLMLMVPWGIVVLNVLVTMLNSLLEREKEVFILSSVGLNPSQITAIFIMEASILGVISGGIGYFMGYGLYRLMAFLELAVGVHQKISPFWSLASIGIAMAATLAGTLVALKRSTIITPSLMRRWKISKKRENLSEPFEITIPVKLLLEDVDDFIEYVVQALKGHEKDLVRRISSIRVLSDTQRNMKVISFVYRATSSLDGANFYTENSLYIDEDSQGEILVMLKSNGNRDHAYDTGALVRMIVMEWSTVQGKIGGSYKRIE